MTRRILVVEDEKRINDTIASYFRREGYQVTCVYDGVQAIEKFQEEDYDLIVLDVMLPMLDGWTVCRKIRRSSNVLIIMLTALEEEEDKLQGFELGVDEYVTKPFSPKVLVARSKALLERYKRDGNVSDDRIVKSSIEIDRKSRIVKIDGEEIILTPKEYGILVYFMENINIALSREQILNKVWGYDFFGDSRVVDTHVKNMRKKLGDKGEAINTLKGFGYRFEEK